MLHSSHFSTFDNYLDYLERCSVGTNRYYVVLLLDCNSIKKRQHVQPKENTEIGLSYSYFEDLNIPPNFYNKAKLVYESWMSEYFAKEDLVAQSDSQIQYALTASQIDSLFFTYPLLAANVTFNHFDLADCIEIARGRLTRNARLNHLFFK